MAAEVDTAAEADEDTSAAEDRDVVREWASGGGKPLGRGGRAVPSAAAGRGGGGRGGGLKTKAAAGSAAAAGGATKKQLFPTAEPTESKMRGLLGAVPPAGGVEYEATAEARQHLFASAREGMVDEWESERSALIEEVEALRGKVKEMEVVTRRHGEMKKSLEGYKVEVDKLRSDMKEREDDLSEEKTKRHLSDSKRRAAEQAVITLKQQCKEMEAEHNNTFEKLTKMRATIEQQGRQVRQLRMKEQREKETENASPTNGLEAAGRMGGGGGSGGGVSSSRAPSSKASSAAGVVKKVKKALPEPAPPSVHSQNSPQGSMSSPESSYAGESVRSSAIATHKPRSHTSFASSHTGTVAAAAAAAAAMAVAPGGNGAMAEEVRTLRQTVGELEAYTIELEDQILQLERQLDSANEQLHHQASHAHALHAEDERKLWVAKEEAAASRAELDGLLERAGALDAANESLTVANASLSEQVRKLRAERKPGQVVGRTLEKIAENALNDASKAIDVAQAPSAEPPPPRSVKVALAAQHGSTPVLPASGSSRRQLFSVVVVL